MFITDKLVFTELHKTGGTHIRKWLQALVGGRQLGKHNRIPREYWDRLLIGSVRSPWDWYVSLWAFGCGQRGAVYSCTTRRIQLRYIAKQLHSEMGVPSIGPARWFTQVSRDLVKPAGSWRGLYRDALDRDAFRVWLRQLLNRSRRFDIGEGYGFSPVSRVFGLMTYRYLKLFTRIGNDLYRDEELGTESGVKAALDAFMLVDYVIRNENLEDDLLKALELAGYSISDEKRAALFDGGRNRTNSSKRTETKYYYDEETIALVAEKERLLIDLYGYIAPA